ncbi:MAG: DUF58 domain-containing protein [Cyanobacteriota bacterium]|nr:DUF58 domain-containing protein [Cyanobacteriota bacterium]
MGFAERLPKALQRRLSRREAVLKLGLRNLYIVPSSFGGLWLLTGGILYLVGINGRSNGPVLLSLLMLALLLLNLFLTHLNLQGLELRALEGSCSCADEAAAVPLLLLSNSPRAGLKLRWLTPRGSQQHQLLLHLEAGSSRISVPWQPSQRGLQRPGRLLIQTTAPMGLFRCWGYWEPPIDVPIAPARTPGPVQELSRAERQQSGALLSGGQGSDHFAELQPLRPQEGLQRVAWKTVARGQGWYGKRFEAEQAAGLWLAPATGVAPEQALEHLCERLCRGLAAGERLGLLLPGGAEIPPGTGPNQLERCLLALAQLPQ